jgi:hypothetical protein
MMVEASNTSEMPINFYQSTWYKISEDCIFSASTLHPILSDEMKLKNTGVEVLWRSSRLFHVDKSRKMPDTK